MLAGHFGAGLVLKSRYPSVPLLAILVAAELPDLLWVLFASLGWEKLAAVPAHPLRPDTLGPMVFSHDVSMILIYACILGAVGMLLSSLEGCLALALALLSHLGLDLLVHAPDIGVGGPWVPVHVGLDLWRRAPFFSWLLEMLMVLGGGTLYLHARVPGRDGAGRARTLVGVLVAAHLAALAVW